MRIDFQQDQISDDVSQQCQKRRDDQDPHDDRIVPTHRALVKEQTHTVDGEDRLQDHRSTDDSR